MSRRLLVRLDRVELAEIPKAARRQGLTTNEWVRQALRAARRAEPGTDANKKLAIIRAASQYSFPIAEIEDMLAEIGRGFSTA